MQLSSLHLSATSACPALHFNPCPCLPLPPAATSLCRYSKLSDKELLHRLLQVCQAEGVAHTPDGLEAVVFTADGDMRQALNNVQVRWVGWVGWVGEKVRLSRKSGERGWGMAAADAQCCLWLRWQAPAVSHQPLHVVSVLPCPARPPQATANGFGLVSQEAVFRVCDQPHPVLVSSVVKQCMDARIDDAYNGMKVGRAAAW